MTYRNLYDIFNSAFTFEILERVGRKVKILKKGYYMCKLGDIIVVKEYIGDDGERIGKHSFIVVDDNNGMIKGLDYSMVTSVISSFKNKRHRKYKLKFDENIEVKNEALDGQKELKKPSYVKADKLFYFNKNNLDYYVFARVSDDFLDELLKVILQLSERDKLTIVTNNL